jgi:hypothetical protein
MEGIMLVKRIQETKVHGRQEEYHAIYLMG